MVAIFWTDSLMSDTCDLGACEIPEVYCNSGRIRPGGVALRLRLTASIQLLFLVRAAFAAASPLSAWKKPDHQLPPFPALDRPTHPDWHGVQPQCRVARQFAASGLLLPTSSLHHLRPPYYLRSSHISDTAANLTTWRGGNLTMASANIVTFSFHFFFLGWGSSVATIPSSAWNIAWISAALIPRLRETCWYFVPWSKTSLSCWLHNRCLRLLDAHVVLHHRRLRHQCSTSYSQCIQWPQYDVRLATTKLSDSQNLQYILGTLSCTNYIL